VERIITFKVIAAGEGNVFDSLKCTDAWGRFPHRPPDEVVAPTVTRDAVKALNAVEQRLSALLSKKDFPAYIDGNGPRNKTARLKPVSTAVIPAPTESLQLQRLVLNNHWQLRHIDRIYYMASTTGF